MRHAITATMSTSHKIRWSHGEAEVTTLAAMLTDCRFALPTGPFRPFARAPWLGTVDDPAIIGHLRVLSGDFVCLPMGTGRPMPDAPEPWATLNAAYPPYHPIHGPAADAEWEITRADETSVTLTLVYPQDSAVERIERTISGRADAPALDFTMTVFARRKTPMSLGLHPMFRLPEQAGRLRLDADFAFGLIHPGRLRPGDTMEFSSLSEVPLPEGAVDFSHVPLTPKMDCNVQMCGMTTPLTATWLDEGAGIVLDWDRELIPSMQIWHTDGGIGGDPWNHQFRAIGLEPVAAAFDLNDKVSIGPNPINARGVRTSVDLDPASPLVVRYSVTAFTA